MSDTELPILYDLVARKGEDLPFYSPNTCKARLALVHKGLDFATREITYDDTRGPLARRLGIEKATAPVLELPSGELIMDSLAIAEYLEKTYPGRPSLFFPGAQVPVDAASSHAKMAKAFLALFAAGLGWADSQWSPIWELSCVKLCEQQDASGGPNSTQEYWKSAERLGSTNEYARIAALDQDALVARAKASLGPVEATLRVSPWLAGDDASFTDFILYGRYMMHATADKTQAEEVWKGWPRVAEWIARLEAKYAHSSEWRDALRRRNDDKR